MDLERVAAIFQVIADFLRFGGQLSRFAYRNESRIKPVGKRRPEDKSASFHAKDEVNLFADIVFRERINQTSEAKFVLEQRGDVIEQDALFREVGYLADQLLQPVAVYWVGRHLGRHPGLHFKAKLLELEMN